MLLTRDDDRNVSLNARAAMANSNKADLFISLHANASFSPAVTGASILYAAFDREAEQSAARIARIGRSFGRSAADSATSTSCSGTWRRFDTSIDPRSSASFSKLSSGLTFHWRRIATERLPLSVLESANMPAVLIEMGYLSNADQEKRMAGNEFQNTVAQAVCRRRGEVPRHGQAGCRAMTTVQARPRHRGWSRGRSRGLSWFVITPCVTRRQRFDCPGAGRRHPGHASATGRKIKARLFYVRRRWREIDWTGTRRRFWRRGHRTGAAHHRSADCSGRRAIHLRGAARHDAASALRDGTRRAFVDLSKEVVSRHTGGSTNEALTVYTLVDALTANLPAIQSVQILVDGKQVETLAGHIDLRRPLERTSRG